MPKSLHRQKIDKLKAKAKRLRGSLERYREEIRKLKRKEDVLLNNPLMGIIGRTGIWNTAPNQIDLNIEAGDVFQELEEVEREIERLEAEPYKRPCPFRMKKTFVRVHFVTTSGGGFTTMELKEGAIGNFSTEPVKFARGTLEIQYEDGSQIAIRSPGGDIVEGETWIVDDPLGWVVSITWELVE